MAFNPLANFNEGLGVGQNILSSQRNNQIRGLQDALSGQIQQGGFDPSQSLDFQQLSVLDPTGAERTRSTFENLSGERKKAYHQDLQGVLNSLKSGDIESAATLLNDRRNDVLTLNGDTSGVDLLISKLNEGAFPEMIERLSVVEQVGIDNEYLPDPALRQAKIGRLNTPVALSEPEKNFNRLTGLKQQLAAAEKTGDKPAITAAKQQLSDFQKLTGKFGISEEEKSNIKVNEASNKVLSTQAAVASKEAFDSMKKVRTSTGNMTDAIRALNKGANTGPIVSMLPSFRESTIELDNIRGKMGLDIVGATSFGALSESELKFALDVALPDNLEPEALKVWLTEKRDAQRKLGKELLKAATFLGKPGNTISKYIEQETGAGRLSFDAVEGEDDISTVSDDDLFH